MQYAAQAEQRYKSKYEKVGVLPIRIVKSNVSSVGSSSERNRRANARNVRFIIHIGSTPTFSYFDLKNKMGREGEDKGGKARQKEGKRGKGYGREARKGMEGKPERGWKGVEGRGREQKEGKGSRREGKGVEGEQKGEKGREREGKGVEARERE